MSMLGQAPTFEKQTTPLLPLSSEAEKPGGIFGWFRRFWGWLISEEDTAPKEHRSNVVIDAVKSKIEGIYDSYTISSEEAARLECEHKAALKRQTAVEKKQAAEIGIQADGKPIYLSDLSFKETIPGGAAGADQEKQNHPDDFSLRTWPLGFAREQKADEGPAAETAGQSETPAMRPQTPDTTGDAPVIVVVSPEAPQEQGEHKETPDPANENPAPVVVEKKKGKGFFKGLFTGAALNAAALGATKYGVREGMTQLGWLGGPGGVFATAAGSSFVVTGFAIRGDYSETKKKILEEMKKKNPESVWDKQARREVFKTIFNKEGRKKYAVTAAKSFAGGLVGGSAVAALADFVESPDDATSYLKNKISFLKDKFDSAKGTISAECGALKSKCESLLGIAPSTATPSAASTPVAPPAQVEPSLKDRLVGRNLGVSPAAVINPHLAMVPAAASANPLLPIGGDGSPIPDGKEPLIMPVLENFEDYADKGGLEPSTVEKIAEAGHSDPKAIWKLADNFANGTGGVEQDNGMAKIFCAEADRLLEKDSICPEGDLTKDHDALFEKQFEQWDAENAASDARLAELDEKIEEIRTENDGHIAELKSHFDKMDEHIAEQKIILDEILGPEEVSTLQDAEETASEPGEECAVTDNGDGTYEVVCRSMDLSVGDEFIAHINMK